MRQIVALIFTFIFLMVAIATGAFLLIAAALTVAGLMLTLFIREKITGKKVAFTRFYRFEERSSETDDTTVIDAEYKEIKSDRRID